MQTPELPGTGGRIKQELEDFFVEEIPAYLPSGKGDHIYAFVEKRGLTTDDLIRRLAKFLGVSPAQVGCAGRKDKDAVTRQWLSFPASIEISRLTDCDIENIRVLQTSRHTNKLRTGHLKGNRFRIVVRDAEPDAEEKALTIIERISEEGLANCFGPQRFGHQGLNVPAALAWIVGGRKPPRNKGRRKLLVSSLQALLFNRIVEKRMEQGILGLPLAGDVMKRHDTGGMFVAEDVDEVRKRAKERLVSPTGPIYGDKMWWPEQQALALEEEVLAEFDLTKKDLARFRKDGRGSRRTLRVFPDSPTVQKEGENLCLSFGLESGSFATTFLAEITKIEELFCPTRLPESSFPDQTEDHSNNGERKNDANDTLTP